MDASLQFQKDFHKICSNCGDRIAITYIKKNETLEEFSYTRMEKKVLERAKTYESRGIRRGDRIAVLIPICPDAYLTILTLAYMGVTSVILDCNLHKEELGRLLEDADVSGIITTYFLYQTKMASVSVAAFSEFPCFRIYRCYGSSSSRRYAGNDGGVVCNTACEWISDL